MRDAEEAPSLEPQNSTEQPEVRSFFHFEVSPALNWRLDWCDLQDSFQPKFCYETLVLDSSAFWKSWAPLKTELFQWGSEELE